MSEDKKKWGGHDLDSIHECYATEIDHHYILWHWTDYRADYSQASVLGVEDDFAKAKRRLYQKLKQEAERMAKRFGGEISDKIRPYEDRTLG